MKKHGARKENRKDVLGNRRLFVNEMYVMEGNTCKGWQPVNRIMTVSEINRLFKSGAIATINVKRNEKEYWGRDYNNNTFRIEFPTLETYFERLVEEAEFIIRYKNGVEFDKSKLVYKIEDLKIWRLSGIYWLNSISLDEKCLLDGIYGKISEERMIEVIIHEIGHHIHRIHFDDKQFRLPTIGKSKYAYKDYKENFAEAFMDLMVGRKRPVERNKKMKQILFNI